MTLFRPTTDRRIQFVAGLNVIELRFKKLRLGVEFLGKGLVSLGG